MSATASERYREVMGEVLKVVGESERASRISTQRVWTRRWPFRKTVTEHDWPSFLRELHWRGERWRGPFVP